MKIGAHTRNAILAALAIVLAGAIAFLLILPNFRDQGIHRVNRRTAKSLLLVLRSYESDFGSLPPTDRAAGPAAFSELMRVLETNAPLDWPEALWWEDPDTGERHPWIYVPAASLEGSFSRRPVLISPNPNTRGRFIVAYAGGQVIDEPADSWQAFLREAIPAEPPPPEP